MEGFVFLFLVAIVVGYRLADRTLRQRRTLRLKEMVHKERLMALEHGIPVAELPDEELEEQLMSTGEAGMVETSGPFSNGKAMLWVRVMALGVGLLSVFTGLGWYFGMSLVPDTTLTAGMAEMASVGFIPVLGGIGLLLFYALTRNLEV